MILNTIGGDEQLWTENSQEIELAAKIWIFWRPAEALERSQ